LSVSAKDAITMDVTILISGQMVVNSGVHSGSPDNSDHSD